MITPPTGGLTLRVSTQTHLCSVVGGHCQILCAIIVVTQLGLCCEK